MSDPQQKTRSWRRRLLQAVGSIAIAAVLLEGLVRFRTVDEGGFHRFAGVDLLPWPVLIEKRERGLDLRPEDEPYLVSDPATGWTIRPHSTGRGGLYSANGLGLRAPRELPVPRPEGVRRVLVVGDSLAHGDDIPWPETWIAQVEPSLGPDREIWCGAVPGFGTDQALLRLDVLLPIVQPDTVILTVYRQNLLRNLTFFRSLQFRRSAIPWSKPRFVLHDDGSLELMNQPAAPPTEVRSILLGYGTHPLSRHDLFWFQDLYTDDSRYNSRVWRFLISRDRLRWFDEQSSAYLRGGGAGIRLGVALVRRFLDTAAATGFRPLVVILPDHEDVASIRSGDPLMAPFTDALVAAGIPFLDTGPLLAATLSQDESVAAVFAQGEGHPNGRACAVIAGAIGEALRE